MILKNRKTANPFFVFFCILLCANMGLGQEAINDQDQASMMFEFDFKQIRNCEFIKMFGADEFVEMMDLTEDNLEMDPLSVDRLYGAFDWPDDAQEIAEFQGQGDTPFSFIWVIEFNKAGAGKQLVEEMMEFFKSKEIEGVTYYYPEEMPDLLFHFDEMKIALGTSNYLLSDGDFYTPELEKLVNEMPSAAIRAAIDVKTAKPFLNSIVEMPEEDRWMVVDFPNELIQAFAFYRHADSASLFINPDGPTLAKMVVNSDSDESAEKLNNDVSQLFNIAKLFGPATIAEEIGLDDENKSILESLLDQLTINQNANTNTASVEAPEGFDTFVQTLVSLGKAQAAQNQKMNRFREAAIAIHNFHDSYKGLPFNMDRFSDQLSWRAKVAQFSWDDRIDFTFDMEQGWDAEPNKAFADQLPNMFRGKGGKTNICWIKSDVKTLETIMDGTSNTIMLLESTNPVPWTQPQDLTVLQAIKMVRGLKDGEKLVAVCYDASTFMIDNTFDHNELKALFSPDDGKMVDIWNR